MPTAVWLMILKAVDEVSRENALGVAPVREIIRRLNSPEHSVRNILSRMKKAGLVESPVYGCYRLTAKGKELLRQLEGLPA